MSTKPFSILRDGLNKELEEKYPYKFRLIIGDWSNDGHEKSEEYFFLSNYSPQDVAHCFAEAQKAFKIDLVEMCSSYGEYFIYMDDVQRLIALGMDSLMDEDNALRYDLEDKNYTLDPDLYVKIWCFLIQKYNSNIMLVQTRDDVPSMNYYIAKELGEKSRGVTLGYGMFE